MTNNTNPIFAALSAAFVAELGQAYLDYCGDEYADEYFSDAVDEATRRAGNLEADFLPFLGDAAEAYGDRFNDWVDSRVPVYTDELATLWMQLGCPEPESDGGGGIPARMSLAVYDVIAEQACDAAEKLAELAAGFNERYSAAEERAQAEADAEADELEAILELERRGYKSNYLGIFSVAVTVTDPFVGELVKFAVFDTATAALDAVLDKEAAAAD